MAISQKLIMEIIRLEDKQNDYQPSPEISAKLKDKTLVLVVGPACAGKTTTINRAAELDDRFAVVGSFTTRDARDDEGGKKFTYIPHTDVELAKLFVRIEKHEIVQYVVHPTLKHFYGTVIEDYPKTYNLLDFVASGVPMIKKLPFKSSPVVGLVVEASQWRAWFDQRFPVGNSDRDKRLEEAEMSLSWLLDQPEGSINWVINELGKSDEASQEIIRIGTGQSKGMEHGHKYAELLLDTVRKLK